MISIAGKESASEERSETGLNQPTEERELPKININPDDFGYNPDEDPVNGGEEPGNTDDTQVNVGGTIQHIKNKAAADSAKNAVNTIDSITVTTVYELKKRRSRRDFFKDSEQYKKAREYDLMYESEIQKLPEDEQARADELKRRLKEYRRAKKDNNIEDYALNPAEKRSLQSPFEQMFANSEAQYPPWVALIFAIVAIALSRIPQIHS